MMFNFAVSDETTCKIEKKKKKRPVQQVLQVLQGQGEELFHHLVNLNSGRCLRERHGNPEQASQCPKTEKVSLNTSHKLTILQMVVARG